MKRKRRKVKVWSILYTDYSWFYVWYITHFDNNFGWLGWVNGVRSGKSFGSPEDTSIQNRKRCGVGVGPWLPELQTGGWSTAEAQRLRVHRWLLLQCTSLLLVLAAFSSLEGFGKQLPCILLYLPSLFAFSLLRNLEKKSTSTTFLVSCPPSTKGLQWVFRDFMSSVE